MTVQPVLLAGTWRPAVSSSTFPAVNPATQQPLPEPYPVSTWDDCETALQAAAAAAVELQRLSGERIAEFLTAYAARLEARKDAICERANLETALPLKPRLADVEFPRTVNQLRQAAEAARDGSWTQPIIDTKNNLRACFASIGPVAVFGPNNFPCAFNSVAGGDFAAAIAAGNPVIGKANSSHPGTTQLFAEEALAALQETHLPLATVQLLYRTSHADGERLVADPRLGACGYTGSRDAGLKLKAAADAVGKPIYLELSSLNPVLILPGALAERGEALAAEFSTSCLMGTGQFCTNPGLILLLAGAETEIFIERVREKFAAAPVGTLLSASVRKNLEANLATLRAAGAAVLTGGVPGGGTGFSHANTWLRVSGADFLEQAHALQTEVFGNASLAVVAANVDELQQVLEKLEGNLTGCFYTHTQGADDALYQRLVPAVRSRVGRLLNDKMPTGVAVSPAMNHGGPFPATGHAGFTAVGIPAALRRFAMLQCYDNVRPDRLPAVLQNANPNGRVWRSIDGQWTQGPVAS